MTMFFEKPVGLSPERHGHLRLRSDIGFSFAAYSDATPIHVVEMMPLSLHYPIVFTAQDDATPVAVLGLRDGENLFMDQYGEWAREVDVPASVRRYPFMVTPMPDADALALCIDESDWLFDEGDQPLFDADGSLSAMTQEAMAFCTAYHHAEVQTRAFAQDIANSGVLSDAHHELCVSEGEAVRFSGFRVIDEAKLAALDDTVFLDWRRKGYLPLIHAHLFSFMQWSRLERLLHARMKQEAFWSAMPGG